MAVDGYLLESGTDRLLLEDGTGVYTLEPQPAGTVIRIDEATVYEIQSGTSAVIPIPAQIAVGDLLVAVVTHSTSTAIAVPTGWTSAAGLASATALYTRILYRTAVSGDVGGGTYTIPTSGTAGRVTGFMFALRGVNTTTPLDAAATTVTTTSTTGPLVPTLTTVTANAYVISVAAADAATSEIFYAPSPYTVMAENRNTVGRRTAIAERTMGAAGATGTLQWTRTTTTSYETLGIHLAFRPSAAAVTAPTPVLTSRVVGIDGSVKVRTSNADSVRLKAGTDAALTADVVYSPAVIPDANGGSQPTLAGLLSPGTRYYYRIAMTDADGAETLDADSTIGRIEVAPVGPTNFSFCFSSCTDAADSAAMSAVAARGDDLFFHRGDLWYADDTGVNLANYRTQMSAKVAVANHKAVLAATPTVYAPSDHDFSMTNNGNGSTDATARSLFNQVYREHFPAPASMPSSSGVYYAFTWGRVLFLNLDCRTFASVPTATDNSSKTLLGATQKQWVKDQISDSAAAVVCLLGDGPWVGAAEAGDDSWLGYTTERAELAAHFTSSGKRITYLAGDQHAVSADNGSNTTTNPGGIPVFQGAPLNNAASQKGGPYSAGIYPSTGTAVVQQYARIVVTDNGTNVTFAYTGYSSDNTVRVTQTSVFSPPPATPGTISAARSSTWAVDRDAPPPPTDGYATPTFIKAWTAANSASSATIALTVPAGGVAAGHTVIVGLNANGTGTLNSVDDDRGNLWTIDRNSTATTGGQVVSGIITTPLQAGDTITVTGASSIAGRVAVAAEFSGIADTGAYDQEIATSATSATPNSGDTPDTTQTHELVLGFIAPANASAGVITGIDGSYTEADRVNGTSSRSLLMAYKTVTDTGPQSISGTLNASMAWRAVCTTYRAAAAVASTVPVTAIQPTSWAALDSVTAAKATSWTATTPTVATRGTVWRATAAVAAARGTVWTARAVTAVSRAATWRTVATVAAVRGSTWTAASPVTVTRSSAWAIVATVPVTAVRGTSWTSTDAVTAARATTWTATGTVAATRQTVWTSRTAATGSRGSTWTARSSRTSTRGSAWTAWRTVAGTRGTTWSANASTAATRATAWDSLVPATAAISTGWTVTVPAAAARPTSWASATFTTSARGTVWATAAAVTSSRGSTWSAVGPVTVTRTTAWRVDAIGQVTVAATTTWRAAAAVTGIRPTSWTAAATVAALRGTSWASRTAVTPAARPTVWANLTLVAATRAASWQTAAGGPTATRGTTWQTRAALTVTRPTSWRAAAAVTAARGSAWNTAAPTVAARATVWTAQAVAERLTGTVWASRATIAAARSSSWAAAAPVTATRPTAWTDRQTVTATKAAGWASAAFTAATRTATWQAARTVDRLQPTAWANLTSLTATRTAVWSAGARITATRQAAWYVDRTGGASSSRQTGWTSRATITAARQTGWSVAPVLFPVAATRSTSWAALGPATAARATSWANRAAVAAATRPTFWTGYASAASTRSSTWAAYAVRAATRATLWANLTGIAAATRQTVWRADAIGGVAAARGSTWNVAAVTVSARTTGWQTTITATATRVTVWQITDPVAATRATLWTSRAATTTERVTGWADLTVTAVTHRAVWTVRTTDKVAADRSTAWTSLALTVTYRTGTWRIRQLLPRYTYRDVTDGTFRPSTGTTPPTPDGTFRPSDGTTPFHPAPTVYRT